ncbi:MAG TPA: hypothetical protein VGH19_02895 [Verrucomicrobiae bacterium]
MTTERKKDLKRRLQKARFPRRSAAKFTDENDHNPEILQDCPKCHGCGRIDELSTRPDGTKIRTLKSCSACRGTGTTGEVERYFLTDDPEVTAIATPTGRLTCPKCGWHFTTNDPNRWTGRRHIRCGQKIKITTTNAPSS